MRKKCDRCGKGLPGSESSAWCRDCQRVGMDRPTGFHGPNRPWAVKSQRKAEAAKWTSP